MDTEKNIHGRGPRAYLAWGSWVDFVLPSAAQVFRIKKGVQKKQERQTREQGLSAGNVSEDGWNINTVWDELQSGDHEDTLIGRDGVDGRKINGRRRGEESYFPS